MCLYPKTQRQQIYDVKNNNKTETQEILAMASGTEIRTVAISAHNGPGRLLMRFYTEIIVMCVGLALCFRYGTGELLRTLRRNNMQIKNSEEIDKIHVPIA